LSYDQLLKFCIHVQYLTSSHLATPCECHYFNLHLLATNLFDIQASQPVGHAFTGSD